MKKFILIAAVSESRARAGTWQRVHDHEETDPFHDENYGYASGADRDVVQHRD
jgi:hypothetical protein